MENRAPGRFRFQVASSLDFGCLQDGFWRRPGPSWEPSWAKLAAKAEAKSRKNQCKNASKNRYLSRSIFNAMLVDLGRENGGKLATKSNEKWMWTARGEIFKKPCFSLGKTVILKVREVKKSMKNASKNYSKMKPKMEWHLASIFNGFRWFWEAKLGGKSFQNPSKNPSEII